MLTAVLGHVWLIGFSGSGKSTVGPLLATRLHRRFLDTDNMIELQVHQTINQIFAVHGERYFRALESDVISRLASARFPMVISLGGGAFQSAGNRAMIQQNGVSIYLRTEPRTLLKRLKTGTDRPLLAASPGEGRSVSQARLERIMSLLARRELKYRTAAIIIDTDRLRPSQVVNRICTQLECA